MSKHTEALVLRAVRAGIVVIWIRTRQRYRALEGSNGCFLGFRNRIDTSWHLMGQVNDRPSRDDDREGRTNRSKSCFRRLVINKDVNRC
jgi:hypothetical protein